MKKYKLRKDLSIEVNGKTLYRVEYLIDSEYFKKGDLGGYIEKESNLDHFGNCAVFNDARVSGNARVSCNAQVSGNARISGNALVYGNARISDNARISGNARVSGDAQVSFYLELNKPEQLINITGLEYNITITYCYVQVGCKFYMLDEIDNISYDSVKDELSEEEFYTMKQLIDISLEAILSKME